MPETFFHPDSPLKFATQQECDNHAHNGRGLDRMISRVRAEFARQEAEDRRRSFHFHCRSLGRCISPDHGNCTEKFGS